MDEIEKETGPKDISARPSVLNELLNLNFARGNSKEIVDLVHDQFQYHTWDLNQKDAGDEVRKALEAACVVIIAQVPPCPDRTTALRKLREARMDANSAITHRGKY